jgi:hypothetical protein
VLLPTSDSESTLSLCVHTLLIRVVKAFWNVVNWDAVDQWYGLIKRKHHDPAHEGHND